MYLDETQETDVVIEEKKEIVPDKEAIEKNKKEKEKKELEKIKKETQETLKKESKANLTKSIINANKDLNNDNTGTAISTNISASISTIKEPSLSNSKIKNNLEATEDFETQSVVSTYNSSANNSEDESEETNSNYTLKIESLKDNKIDDELNIESLDDPDKIDLNIVDMKSNISEDDELCLDIQELK
jgi:hypothetical protein